MNDDKVTEFIIRIESKLSSIDTKVDGIREIVKNHESRIQKLETSDDKAGDTFKEKMLEFLGKALIGSISVIIALTSAGGILVKFLGK